MEDFGKVMSSQKGEMVVPKSDFSIVVVLFDFVTILILIWFSYWLEDRQMNYIEKF